MKLHCYYYLENKSYDGLYIIPYSISVSEDIFIKSMKKWANYNYTKYIPRSCVKNILGYYPYTTTKWPGKSI